MSRGFRKIGNILLNMFPLINIIGHFGGDYDQLTPEKVATYFKRALHPGKTLL